MAATAELHRALAHNYPLAIRLRTLIAPALLYIRAGYLQRSSPVQSTKLRLAAAAVRLRA